MVNGGSLVGTMYPPYIVKRTQIYLDAAQAERLSRRAAASGATSSRLIREAIESYLTAAVDEETELARQRQAVDEAFGSIGRLPEGRTYVDAVRAQDDARMHDLEARWRSR